MRYESEVLYDLMKRDGLLNPSQDNLPYESELKEKYVDEVKGAYPKVTDYRPEWLNYNLGYYIPADFPTESLVNVTSGTVNNVIPYAYKSAILKGQTLVNLAPSNYKIDWTLERNVWKSAFLYRNSETEASRIKVIAPMKPSTKYLIICNIIENDATGETLLINTDNSCVFTEIHKVPVGTKGIYKFTMTTKDDLTGTENVIRAQSGGVGGTGNSKFVVESFMIIEYQDGMENWDIQYFEGMQSVKMPVLTTSNEDGTKTNVLTVNEDVTLRGIGEGSNRVEDELDCLTGEVTERIGEIVLDGSENWGIISLSEDNIYFQVKVNNIINQLVNPTKVFVLCDKYSAKTQNDIVNLKQDGISAQWSGNQLIIRDTSVTNISELKNKLAQSPITVNYVLETSTIKTVDLTSVNQDGVPSTFRPFEGTMPVKTDGEPLKPLLDIEVPVEAITQNLASFVNLEGVERTVNEYVEEEIIGDDVDEQQLL